MDSSVFERQNSKPEPIEPKVLPNQALSSTPIGTILSSEGQITSAQLREVVAIQQRTGRRIVSILIEKGYIDEDTILNVLSRKYNYQTIQLKDLSPSPQALKLLYQDMARAYMVLPLSLEADTLVVAMTDPTDSRIIEIISDHTGKRIKALAAKESEIAKALETYYSKDLKKTKTIIARHKKSHNRQKEFMVNDFGSLVSEAVKMFQANLPKQDLAKDSLMASEAPIVKLVNGIILKAIKEKVSDIHFEPFENSFQVRFRIDGTMYKEMNLPLDIKNALIARIKILAKLDISERRLPQDGRITFQVHASQSVDVRVSALPTMFGESIVMRLLDRNSLNIDLNKLGIMPGTLKQIYSCLNRPYGLILVTGPTGSGKTTTLYSMLNKLNSTEVKILTVEDPVEFHFQGINQVQVKEDIGMGFAAALKAFLRQDPDIIMVGEIRDLETAEIVVKAAMTGHLVFATLHTNDCASTIIRLKDIGIPSYLLASTLSMVVSQRLVRKLCPHCKARDCTYSDNDLENQGFSKNEIPNISIMAPKGCFNCHGTGYKGRTGLYELMTITDQLAEEITADVPEYQLRRTALASGMVSLREAGLEKVKSLETSLDEVVRHTIITKINN